MAFLKRIAGLFSVGGERKPCVGQARWQALRCVALAVAFTALAAQAGTEANGLSRVESGVELSAEVLEEVVVVGRRPGPPLWRVSNGDHQLWIFGLVDPVPRKLKWDSSSVQAILVDAAVYLEPPTVSAIVSNPFKMIGVLRQFGKLKRLPAKQRLEMVVPPASYQRFTDAAAMVGLSASRYQRLRPLFAADALRERIWEQLRFESSERLQQRLRKLAKGAGAQRIEHTAEVDVDAALNIFRAIPISQEVVCLETTVAALGEDTKAVRARVLSWADGNAQALTRLDYPDPQQTCGSNLFTSAEAQAAIQRANGAWLASAIAALEQHSTSFGALRLRNLLNADGLLQQLADRGYQIRGQR